MRFDGAIIKEQNVRFGIAIVESRVLNTPEANKSIMAFQQILGVAPVVLMAQNSRGVPTYYGRRDIVDFLAHIDMRRIPWRTYTYSLN
jgi:hypothetical protein